VGVWPFYPKDRTPRCYDRWVFAFIPGAATASAAGEPLSTTRSRLLAQGWAEVEPPDASNPNPNVVLSEPLNRPRPCGPSSSSAELEKASSWNYMFAVGEGNGWDQVVRVDRQTVAYDAPADSTTPKCSNIGTARTNAWNLNILCSWDWDGGGCGSLARPFVEWRFGERAPSAWELAMMGVNMLYHSKFLTPPPQITEASVTEASLSPTPTPSNGTRRLAEDSGEFPPEFTCLERDGDLPPECGVRKPPSDWSASCPLSVGAQHTCYYMPTVGEAGKIHGCNMPTVGEAGDNAGELSAATTTNNGEGPPNPYCMSLFPPTWRATDWYVAHKLDALNQDGGDTATALLIAGVVLVSFFGCSGVFALVMASKMN